MVACGALKDPALLPRYQAYLVPKAKGQGELELLPTDPIAVTAAWGVARMGDPRALPLLRVLARRGTTDIRALAVLGLGALGDRASTALVVELAEELDAGDVARAAAAYALGELSATAATPLLATLAEEGDPLPRQMALLALARLSAGKSPGPTRSAVLSAMADAVFAGGDPDSARARAISDSLRRAGAAALTMMAAPAKEGHAKGEIFPVPDGPVQVESLLTTLVPTGFSAKERAAVLTLHADVLQRAAETALETSSERARTVLAALAEGSSSIEPFLGPDADPATDAARAKAKALIAAIEPGVLALVRHPDARLRTQAISLLATSESDAAASVLVDALSDADESVQRVALAALGTHTSHREPRALDTVARVLSKTDAWSLRVLAAEALGRLGAPGGGSAPSVAASHLEQAALGDPYAMVREAALRALNAVDPPAARAVAQRLVASDPEPRVQESAKAILGTASPVTPADAAPR